MRTLVRRSAGQRPKRRRGARSASAAHPGEARPIPPAPPFAQQMASFAARNRSEATQSGIGANRAAVWAEPERSESIPPSPPFCGSAPKFWDFRRARTGARVGRNGRPAFRWREVAGPRTRPWGKISLVRLGCLRPCAPRATAVFWREPPTIVIGRSPHD